MKQMSVIKGAYLVEASKKEIDALIQKEIYKKSNAWDFGFLDNEYGEISGDRVSLTAINVHYRWKIGNFTPVLGPFIKLNINVKEDDKEEHRTELTFKRLNGVTYVVKYWGIMIFLVLALLVSAYIYVKTSTGEIIFMIPGMGLFYLLILELIAIGRTSDLKRKILKLIEKEDITYTRKETK